MAGGPLFTLDEDAILRANPYATTGELRDLLPGRDPHVSLHHRRTLGMREGWRAGSSYRPVDHTPQATTERDDAEENAQLRATANRLQRQLSEAKAKTAELIEATYQAAKDAALIVGPASVSLPSKDRRKSDPEVALLHCSDWHLGKRTISFDTEIARTRVATLTAKVLRLTEIERADHPVRHAVIMLGGDMCDSLNIYPGHAYEVDTTLYEQVFTAAQLIEGLVLSLASAFESVEVWPVRGNHGRLGRRGDYNPGDNVDAIIYRIVAERNAAKNVAWKLSTNWHQILTIGNYKAMLVHGHQIKSFGGQTPHYGISRKANAWASGVIATPWNDLYLGHFHGWADILLARGDGHIFMTPSIESDNEFAQEFVGASGVPAQRLHFVSPKRGRVTTIRQVYLDGDGNR